MIRKKNSFLTFCFSFMPGAGQMYMGFMKRGISLMASFLIIILTAMWLRFNSILLALPVIWFYAFFDTFNLRSTPDDEFYTLEDRYILFPDIVKGKSHLLQSKFRNIIAFVLIIIGISILWNNFCDFLYNLLPETISIIIIHFNNLIPQLIVAFAIIALGVYLINGKKNDLNSEDNMPQLEDKGGMR
jgi:hypothetical protein